MSIDASQVAPIVVTRGNVSLAPMFNTLAGVGFADGYIWNNGGGDQDLGVYGRYAAIEKVRAPVIVVQDDDCVLPPETIKGLLAAYEPGKIVANMPAAFRRPFYTEHCLVGLGAIFDRDLPRQAFERFDYDEGMLDEFFFRRTCDVIFTALTPFTLVDLPVEILDYARGEGRMFKDPNHSIERKRALDLALKVRDA